MKTNLMFGLVTCAAAERVEFLWNDKDVNGTRGTIQDWIWTQSEESLQTTEGSSRRLGCSLSSLETEMIPQHRPHQDRLSRTAPTSTAPTPPAPPPSLKKALSSYIDESAGKSEEAHLIQELQQWSENCNKVPPNFPKQDAKLKTALLLSTRRKHKSVAEALLATNAVDPNARYKNDGAAYDIATVITANHPCVHVDDAAMMSFCMAKMDDLFRVLTETANVGFTTLHLAVAASDKDMVNTIVRGGADITAATAYGLTPLHLAVMIPGNQEIVGLLVRHGADILTRDGFKWTVLDLAAELDLAALLDLTRGKWVNVRAMWEALHGKLEELEKGSHRLKAQLKSAFVGNIPDIVLGYLRPAQKDFENKIEALEDLRKPLEESRKIKALEDLQKLFEELRWYFTTCKGKVFDHSH